jgi:hypothetical protein
MSMPTASRIYQASGLGRLMLQTTRDIGARCHVYLALALADIICPADVSSHARHWCNTYFAIFAVAIVY